MIPMFCSRQAHIATGDWTQVMSWFPNLIRTALAMAVPAVKKPSPRITKRAILARGFAWRLRRKRIGKRAQRKSMITEKADIV